jgi:hypothetical protein
VPSMDHEDALRRGAVEKYLLNEMPPPERDDFEAHFFDCLDCAADLRATAAFLGGVKQALRRSPLPKTAPRRRKKPWFEFFGQPAFAAPAFALLLLVVAYQNIALLPRFTHATAEHNKPEILTSLSLIGGNSRGGTVPSATMSPGQPLLISLDIPTAERFSSYICVLLDPAGAVVWRLPVSAAQATDTVPIRVPSGVLAPGDYRLVVKGQPIPGGQSAELVTYRFTLNSDH